MSDNVVQTLQKLIQDVIAPDVRETKVRLESQGKETNTRFDAVSERFDAVSERFDAMQKQIDARFESVSERFESVSERFDAMQKQIDFRFEAVEKQIQSLSKENEAQYKAILAAIGASRAESGLAGMSEIASLRERVAILESKAA